MPGLKIFHLKYPWGVSWTGMMLLSAGGKKVLVDSAVEGVALWLNDFFLREGLSPDLPSWIVNTHTHADHAGGNPELRRLAHACFALHQNAVDEMIQSTGITPDLVLRDQMPFELEGIRFHAVHTPGHSADSISVLEESTGTLFTGDSFQGLGSPYSGIALYRDSFAYRLSTEKVRDLFLQGRVNRILCGHAFKPFDGVVEKNDIPEFLDACTRASQLYETLVRKCLDSRPDASPAEIGKKLLSEYSILPSPSMPELAEITASAHFD